MDLFGVLVLAILLILKQNFEHFFFFVKTLKKR